VAPVLGQLAAFPDGAAARASYHAAGRETALIVVRQGEMLRVYEDVCPHQFLPLTYCGDRVLSQDGERLRCTNHGAEFAVEDGRALSGPCNGCGLTRIAVRVAADGSVLIEDGQDPAGSG
jgi:nitrite reductase/ring-hydroxylating ferredoxin subunit